MSAIDNLQKAIKAAASSGAFALDSGFLAKGLNDSTVKVPEWYDTGLARAFQVKAAADFSITVDAGHIGEVSNDSFTVTQVSIPFLGGSLASEATLVFGLSSDSTTLVVQILSEPKNWTWTSSFAFMSGFPFNQLSIASAKFIFSTADGNYPWTDESGLSVEGGGPKQNFFAALSFPAILQPFLSLFNGLSAPSGTLNLTGVLDMAAYDGEQVLFPTGKLTAELSDQTFQLIYLTVSSPSVTLTLPEPSTGQEDAGDQSPTLGITAKIGVGSGTAAYLLEVQIPLPGAPGASTEYSIGLASLADGSMMTPSDIVQVVPGGGSFLGSAPAVLQQFLASVGLLGLTLSGEIGPSAKVTAFGIQIGSTQDIDWTPIPFAPKDLNFTIKNFSLLWSIQNPFDKPSRSQYFMFQTQFTLAPAIFKGSTSDTDGLFTVEFDSNLQFSATFDGTASLNDFVSTLTNNAISLDSVLSATLSNIRLQLDGSNLNFTFSSGFDVSLNFLKVGDRPILSISDGEINISAVTPPANQSNSTLALLTSSDDKATVWSGSIQGALAVGPFIANVNLAYDGAQDPPRWNLSAALAQSITVQQLLDQFWQSLGYQFPSFLPGTLTISTFEITAEIPSGKGDLATSYSIATTFSWTFDLGGETIGIDPASLRLAYDGNKPTGQRFSGAATGTFIYTAINLSLTAGYQFEQTDKGTNQTMYIDWEGFRATYNSGQQTLTFTLKGWSLGTLIQALVRTLGTNPYFTLDSPWDLLNSISLDGLSVEVSLDSSATNRIKATYTLSSDINLGFIRIKSLVFFRDSNGKVRLAIDGSTAPALQSAFGDLLDPTKGQDVQNMPAVPGRGNDYFKVYLLAMGQRIGITGYQNFKDTNAVIDALQKVPSTTGKLNPVNPNANDGTPADGIPYYNRDNNWLIAAHLGLLQVAGVWTVDAMFVFNDPNLYGLRLALAGAKAGGLAGLTIDILYKKITDDIGLFQIEFTFPDAIRNINLGAISITLPQIGIQVYTNGDFLIDIGFPYNLDFSRSFSIYAIVYGVPVMGSGGFYFGKLSSATSTSVPTTTKGTFAPVIVFGIGLQLGVGYNFTYGPLSAGFALTIFGIIEGVIASWHPYGTTKALPAEASSSAALQSGYYFKLRGTVGIIGLLYGKVDFAIIQAAVNVKFTVSLQIAYESYREIPIRATVSLSISVSVKIDLGIFSFSISFSFSATLTAQVVIGKNETAPWDDNKLAAACGVFALPSRYRHPDEIARAARQLRFRPRTLLRAAAAGAEKLNLLAAPQFTVLAPQGATNASQQQGAFVFLLAMDAPASGPGDGTTSFEKLCAAYFPWLVDAFSQAQPSSAEFATAAANTVTRTNLEEYIAKLADNENSELTIKALLEFLSASFTLNIQTPSSSNTALSQKLDSASVLFPIFDGLSLTTPAQSGSGSVTIPFETYTTANSAYRTLVSNLFAEVEANLQTQNEDSGKRFKTTMDDGQSMAALVFVDSFALIGRQLMQAAVDALNDYAYPLGDNDSLAGILQAINGIGNNVQAEDVGVANQEHLLSAPLSITIPNLTYVQQGADTLTSIAASFTDSKDKRWAVTEQQLILQNGKTRCLQAGLQVTLTGAQGEVQYTTIPGEYFEHIAETLSISLAALAAQSALYGLKGLLTPGGILTIPAFAYQTTNGDTLKSVAGQFATSVAALINVNTAVQGLFSAADQKGLLSLPKLDVLAVSDLWKAIQATGQVAQTASMLSRFLLYGLRLPKEDGLQFSSGFLYPTSQSGFGLYQLTGQQFPTPAAAPGGGYSINISRAAQSHDVSLDFIYFNDAAGTSADAHLDQAYGLLSIVLGWAQQGKFQPSPTYTALPLSTLVPRSFAVEQFALWSTSDIAALQALTNRASVAQIADTSQAAAQPLLFALPDALLQQLQIRQATLQPLGTFAQTLARMPHYTPQAGSTSPSTNQTDYRDLKSWTWATRIDFQIKRIPASGVVHAQSSGQNVAAVPDTQPDAPTLQNAYEVIGASSSAILLLDQLLIAMDAMGEGIAPGLFFAYAESGASGQGLATLGQEQFLAFLAQTNLSTETNPAADPLRLARLAAGIAMPRGIANPTHEFLRLLWELSVVRSGGYYLYYQTVDGGQGLPASLFDSTGTATVSAVVAFAPAGQYSFGDTVPNFVNAVFTIDNIDTARDILRVASRPGTASTNELSGQPGETLRSLANLYGVSAGSLVTNNPTQTLAPGAILPVAGIWRQLTLADLANPSQTLADLAAHYSAGVVTPITAQDIQNWNPGVSVSLASVFAIPTIQYSVQAASAPGNTFPSIAKYYGLSDDALAVLCLDVPALFSQGALLQLDTQSFDQNPAVGPGNIAIELTRINPGPPPSNPSKEQQDKYAYDFMYQLYHTLSAGLETNPYFKASTSYGLPFGPQKPESQSQPSAFAGHADRLRQRQLQLAANEEAPYHYRQTLGIANCSLSNAAPATSGAGLPPASANPYIGVGTVAQVSLRWQDIFGNTAITPFEQPPSGYNGALNGSANRILYNDLLLPVAAWPNVQTSYRYTGTAGAPTLDVSFHFDTSKYTAPGDQARKDLQQFILVYFQLHQSYKDIRVPGVTGNAVSMKLQNRLLASPMQSLSDTQADQVRGFVADCVKWLSNYVGATALTLTPPSAALSLPVDPAAIAAGDILELGVNLIFTRQSVLVQDTIAALDGGLSASSAILPLPNKNESGAIVYTQFAKDFETAFQTTDWYMKIGEGVAQQGGAAPGQSEQLFAVRFGKATGKGIYFELGNAPSYYAPKPVAKALTSRTVSIIDYKSGNPVTSNFTAVDLNLWFQSCLDAIDTFFSPQYSTAAYILDKALGQDPMKDGYFGKMLAAKQSLADDISSVVIPILSTSASDPSSLWTASSTMRQRLLIALGGAYAAGAIVVYNVGQTGSAPSDLPNNLYGQPSASFAGDKTAANQNYSLSSARFPLTPIIEQEDGTQEKYDPRLSFAFVTKNVTQQSYVPIQLGLDLTHIEFDRTTVPGIDGYIQSRWLVFVNGPLHYSLGTEAANIPVVDRALPAPPTMREQQGLRHADSPASAIKLPLWDYSFDYLYQAVSQDVVQVTIELNVPPSGLRAKAKAEETDLFAALAQFSSAWPDISTDMAAYLPLLGAEEPSADVLAAARKAVSALEQYATQVAAAYHASLQPSVQANAVGLPQKIDVNFEISMQAVEEGIAEVDLLHLTINGAAATWDREKHTITAGRITLPEVVVQIDSDHYAPESHEPPDNVSIAWRYKNKTTHVYMPYSEASANPSRTIALNGLNVLAHQNAWSTLVVKRNRYLFPTGQIDTVQTNSEFLFQTPPVKFADLLVPQLVYKEFTLGQLSSDKVTLESLLENFFAQMFLGGDSSVSIEAAMTGSYSYELLANAPRVSLPVSYLPPAEASVDPSRKPAFCSVVAASIDDWMKMQNPTRNGSPQINFILHVFGGLGEQQPLLIISDLYSEII